MSIRTRLILSYVIIIIGQCGVFWFFYRGVNLKINKNKIILIDRISKTAYDNYIRHTNELTSIGELIVYKNALETAYHLAYLLRNKKRPFDYHELRKDQELRKVAVRPIHSQDYVKPKVNYTCVNDTNGIVVWHPYGNTVEGSNYMALANQYPKLKELIERSFTTNNVCGYYEFIGIENAAKNENGTMEYSPRTKKYCEMVWVPGTPFIACATVNYDDFFMKYLKDLRAQDTDVINASVKAFNEIEWNLILSLTYSLIFISVICIAGGTWFSRTITRPIISLARGVRHFGTGDFSAKVPEEGTPEIQYLSREFNNLGAQLHNYMENLKRETAARHQYESEIKIAREIQAALVPRVFPSAQRDFDLHAILNPAMEIAGDFYDFFFINEQTLAIVIGDVSGKSVPGALFMGVTRTLLRSLCTQVGNPAQVLKFTNDYLCNDNESCMFVTVFLGFYNVINGCLTYANAGHHQAYRLKSDGIIYEFGKLGNPALGIMPEDTYDSGIEEFKTGDKLILFTDGITEAFSPREEMFGEERFKHMLIEYRTAQPEILCADIMNNLNEFQAGDIFDDITMLVLQRN
jgi:sigma-B regulation protein RsbU (phosphoserine phosphatase)